MQWRPKRGTSLYPSGLDGRRHHRERNKTLMVKRDQRNGKTTARNAEDDHNTRNSQLPSLGMAHLDGPSPRCTENTKAQFGPLVDLTCRRL
jgi:hypothetical protein